VAVLGLMIFLHSAGPFTQLSIFRYNKTKNQPFSHHLCEPLSTTRPFKDKDKKELA
jgi:hypothetical protein